MDIGLQQHIGNLPGGVLPRTCGRIAPGALGAGLPLDLRFLFAKVNEDIELGKDAIRLQEFRIPGCPE
jgi:hypothetical protein